jgi:hypothetical protein
MEVARKTTWIKKTDQQGHSLPAWENIPLKVLINLVCSMARRCKDVIKSKGYPTKYYRLPSNTVPRDSN